MTIAEFERKCAILAQTPESRWFELRFRALETLLNNERVPRVDINYLFPGCQFYNFVGYVFKIESKIYFFLVYKDGNVIECFNLETMDTPLLNSLSNTISSHIILSSDDGASRKTFLPLLMMLSHKEKAELKTQINRLFANA